MPNNVQPIQFDFQSFGSGKEIMICFPGFGRRAWEFSKWENSLGKSFKLVAIEHLGLGESKYLDDPISNPIDFDLWKAALDQVLELFKTDQFHLLGYSLGGRLAMWTYFNMPERVKSLKLIAPDGLVMSNWYKFGVFNPIGFRLFRAYVKNPGLGIWVGNMGRKLGFISDKQHKLFEMNALSEEARNNLFNQWMAYRLMETNPKQVAQVIKQHQTSTEIIMGEYDGIIKPHFAKPLLKGGPTVSITNFRSGHNLLHEKLNEYWLNRDRD